MFFALFYWFLVSGMVAEGGLRRGLKQKPASPLETAGGQEASTPKLRAASVVADYAYQCPQLVLLCQHQRQT